MTLTITNLEVTADNKLVFRKNVQNTQPAPQPVQPAPAVDMKKPETSDKASKVKRMNQLVELLNKARYVYEQGVDEIMSNKEYDALYDELNDLENLKTDLKLLFLHLMANFLDENMII